MPFPYTPVGANVWLANLQKGNGSGMNGSNRYQRGSGLGAVYGSLLRTIIPLSKSTTNKTAISLGNKRKKTTAATKRKNKTQKGNGFGIRPTTTVKVAGAPLKVIKKNVKREKAIGKKKTKRDQLGSY